MFAWLVSQADDTVSVTPRLAGGRCLTDLDDAATPVQKVTLEPYGVGVFELRAASGTSEAWGGRLPGHRPV